ncbi:hypothetical protein IAU60_006643 [Kwoniella sp. DSM 27419]
MTAATRKHPMQLALPPRMNLLRCDSGDSGPSTPGPHTPLPYADGGFFDPRQVNAMLEEGKDTFTVGAKRGRDEPDDTITEPEWTEEEVEVVQATLVRPFRPVSTHYPPGELPPPNVIDELTNQIMHYAVSRRRSSPSSPSSSPSEHETTVRWLHSWEATRKKLFEHALAESKFGHDAEERKMTREERQHRPGLRRVDSMDFLDQAEEEEKPADSIGKAIRLSTTLQNSAKQEPLLMSLSRSTSLGSGLDTDVSGAESTSTPVTAITLTPASPVAAPPLRRKGSFRASSSKPLRPSSLLQRGRSFTAEDLRAESETKSDEAEPEGEAQPRPIALASQDLVTSPVALTSLPLPLLAQSSARLTRSQSSSSALQAAPHAARDYFLATPLPSTTDRSALALPLDIEAPVRSTHQAKTSEWSDSEDEAPKQRRKVKKLKQVKAPTGNPPRGGLRGPTGVMAHALDGPETGLRSPFEEREDPLFG